MPIARAIEEAHYPDSFAGRDAALRRLAFDELLALQLGMVAAAAAAGPRRRAAGRHRATPDAVGPVGARRRASAARVGAPIELTVDQVAAIDAIREDLARPTPMLRLLQGDVGSGKTAVAAYALAATARAGLQGALLAPTDLLARQHLETVGALLEELGIGVTLLTGSLKADVKAKALEAIASGQALVVVGTHALIQEAVSFADLGLVVIDEQHRFGVDQRGAARGEGRRPLAARPADDRDADPADPRPGPVRRPRRLRPADAAGRPGRDPDRASSDRPTSRGRGARSATEAALGHRTFVVVPLIEEGADEADGAVAAESEAVRLTALLDPLRVGMVHGRLKPAERDAEMTRFRDGELDVLVGTTVVEVGVDVPAATMMVIQGADRFGLAQLHQLRGRVGRGTVESFCVLVSESTDEVAPGPARGGRRDHTTGSPSPRRTSSCARRATSWGSPRAGSRACGSPRSRSPTHRDLAVRARAHAEALLDADGPDGAAAAGTRRRARGWLAPAGRGRGTGERRVTSAAIVADAGRVIAGTARGIRLEAPGDATRPLGDRVKQTLFAILEPDLRDARVLDLFAGSRRGRDRGPVARRRPRDLRRTGRAARRGHRDEPRPHAPRRPARADRPRRGRSAGWPDPRPPRPARSTSSSSTRRTPRPAVLAATLEALGPHARAGRPGRRQALLARPAAGQRSGC